MESRWSPDAKGVPVVIRYVSCIRRSCLQALDISLNGMEPGQGFESLQVHQVFQRVTERDGKVKPGTPQPYQPKFVTAKAGIDSSYLESAQAIRKSALHF